MIAIASDHGGYDLKERVKKYLEENNIPFRILDVTARQVVIIRYSGMRQRRLWQPVPAKRAL